MLLLCRLKQGSRNLAGDANVRKTAYQVRPYRQIFAIKSELYSKLINVENQLEFDSFVQRDAMAILLNLT
jgi:hypothetical protein